MKFLPLRDFDTVTSALNFDTPDCHVTGGCDLYTTRAAGSDKKLYKDIDKSLESQHAALLKLGASLSPPQREELAASHNLSRSSPFGNLAEISSRRTFAYLIATLNASHPDYDFSHVLRPADFKRERNLRKVMSSLDSTLSNVRPISLAREDSLSRSSSGVGAGAVSDVGQSTLPMWGPQMWALIDKEMALEESTVFSYQPVDDPFDEEEGAIWAHHYFFFNKSRKRVAYLHVRGIPVMSHSPRMLGGGHHGGGMLGPVSILSSKRRGRSIDAGANKRARYWLGDDYADRIVESDDDAFDDGMLWNRGADGDFDDSPQDDDNDDDDDNGYHYDDEEDEDEPEDDEDEAEVDYRQAKKGPVRGVSEDIAARMEIEV